MAFTPDFLQSKEFADIMKQVGAMYPSATVSLVNHGQRNDLEFKKAEARMAVNNPALASTDTLGATQAEAKNIKAAQQGPGPSNTPAATSEAALKTKMTK